MLDSLHRVLGTTDSDWTISHQNSKERHAQGWKELSEGNQMGFAKAIYSRNFYPDGTGEYEKRKGLDNEKLGLEREDVDEATRRTVEMVEGGFRQKVFGALMS